MLTLSGVASSLQGEVRGPASRPGLAEGRVAGRVVRAAGPTQVGALRPSEGLWLRLLSKTGAMAGL